MKAHFFDSVLVGKKVSTVLIQEKYSVAFEFQRSYYLTIQEQRVGLGSK